MINAEPVHKSPKLQPLNLVLYGSMIVLLAFALCYYKLRIFSDTAGYLTDIIRNDGFVIAHNRFISVLNQWLPVLLLKAHASLKVIAVAYSFSYTLVPVALALLCMHWLKRPYHALAIMLLVLLMNVLLFYYAVSELQMGLCLLLFYDSAADYAQQSGRRKVLDVLTIIILPTFAFSHPLCLPVFIGWLLYRLLKERADYRSTGIAVLCFFTAYGIKKIWFTTVYEAQKAFTWEIVRPFGFNYYDGPFAQSIYSHILTQTFMMPAVLLCTIVLLARMRKYRLLILLITMTGGIFTVILLTFEDWSTHFYDHYHEHMLQPAVFFLVLLFCYALAIPESRGHCHHLYDLAGKNQQRPRTAYSPPEVDIRLPRPDG